jgi:hypothetical protein
LLFLLWIHTDTDKPTCGNPDTSKYGHVDQEGSATSKYGHVDLDKKGQCTHTSQTEKCLRCEIVGLNDKREITGK